jgi:hypothetical protein
MLTKTKIALAAALTIGAASSALASDHEDQHWDSLKEMLRQEQMQRVHPTGTLGPSSYGFVPLARKPASERNKSSSGRAPAASR